MRVPRRGGRLSVPKQLANDREPKAQARANACMRMAKIVESYAGNWVMTE